MTMMLAPVPNRTIVVTSGANYSSDSNGIINNVSDLTDLADLQAAGCIILTPPPNECLGYKLQANFNSTADELIPFTFIGKYRIRRITVLNTTVNGMGTAEGGFYTAASKGGTAIVANTQVYSGLTNAATGIDLTLAVTSAVQAAGTLFYKSLTTPQGATAKADIYVYGDVYQ